MANTWKCSRLQPALALYHAGFASAAVLGAFSHSLMCWLSCLEEKLGTTILLLCLNLLLGHPLSGAAF